MEEQTQKQYEQLLYSDLMNMGMTPTNAKKLITANREIVVRIGYQTECPTAGIARILSNAIMAQTLQGVQVEE